MAILKDLIVHGSSRFLNKIYASEIQTPLIKAEAGIIKKLKADDATIVGLLDVQGQLHTSSWTNSNIATIDGSFYITPTIESAQGTVGNISTSTLNFSRKSGGDDFATVSSLYLGNGTSITWPRYSKILITGQILLNGEWIPLGTLLGQLNAAATAASIKVYNITDNKNRNSTILATLANSGITSTTYRNLKISLYQRANGASSFYPLGIYMTATGINGRTFLDIYGGVELLNNNINNSNNYGGFAEPNVRIGNLQGLPSVGGQTPSGWGIYTDNGYFKGIIAADKGYIGSGSKYWVIANEEDVVSRSYIYNGTNSVTSTTEGVYLGTDGIRNYKDDTHNVTIKDGVISALGVDLSGKITASSGSIAGWAIKSTYLINSTTATAPGDNLLLLSPNGTSTRYTIAGQLLSGWTFTSGTTFGINKDGGVYATLGKIGGWNLNSDGFYITNSIPGYDANTLIFSKGTASTNAIGGSDTTSKNWMISAGTGFGVTTTGALYANDAHISGEITATSGTIGGIQIVNGNLNVSSISIGSLNGANNYAQKIDVTQAIDNIEIGGRNLLKDSNTSTYISKNSAIAHLENGADNVPLQSFVVDIEPVQSGTGDPAPTNVRPISGWNAVKVTRTGKNVFNNQFSNRTINGLTWVLNSDGTITVNGTATAETQLHTQFVSGIEGECYFSGCPSGGSSTSYDVFIWDVTNSSRAKKWNRTTTVDSELGEGNAQVYLEKGVTYRFCYRIRNGYTANNVLFSPMIRLASFTDGTYEPCSEVTVTIDLGQTVYGGTLNVLTGVLSITRIGIVYDGTESGWTKSSAYTGSFWINTGVNFAWDGHICSHASLVTALSNYTQGKFYLDGNPLRNINIWVTAENWTLQQFKEWVATQYANGTPLTFSMRLATPITYHLDPQTVRSLYGQNNIFADTGNVTVNYKTNELIGNASQVIPSGTTITISTQVDANDIIWDTSAAHKRIGVSLSLSKDGGGTQYIEAWASSSDENCIGIVERFNTSFHGRIKYTYTLLGDIVLNRPANLYIQGISSGTVTVSNPKIEIGNKGTDWTPAPEDTQENINNVSTTANTALNQSVEYIVGTQTAATGAWKGVTKDNTLRDGKTIMYYLPVAGSGSASLTLTLASGTNTAAIPIYLVTSAATGTVSLTRVTTHYPAKSVIQMTYDATNNQWKTTGYNADTYDKTLYSVSLYASSAISAGRIAVLGLDGKLHLLNTDSFDISCPPLYVGSSYSTTDVTKPTAKTSNYTYRGGTFNLTNTHSIENAAVNSNVYIVGTLTGSIFTPTTTVLTCTQPTTEDGLYYMLLGRMSSTTNAILQAEHPIYVYINGKFQKLEGTTATNFIQANSSGIFIHPAGTNADFTNNGAVGVQINSNSIDIYKPQTGAGSHLPIASYGQTTRIGLNNTSHFLIESGKLSAYSNNSDIYFETSGGSGQVQQKYVVPELPVTLTLSHEIETITSVEVDSVLTTNYSFEKGSTSVILNDRPITATTITIAYTYTVAAVNDAGQEEISVQEIKNLDAVSSELSFNLQYNGTTIQSVSHTPYTLSSNNDIINITNRPSSGTVITIVFTLLNPNPYFTFNNRGIGLKGSGSVSFANEGIATGDSSFVIGTRNTASGKNSFSAGEQNVASAKSSFTLGEHLIANGIGSLITGRYNVANPSSLFTVGNGILNNSSNAFSVLENGDCIIAGRLLQGNGSSSRPIFRVETQVYKAIGIGPGLGYSASRKIEKEGYVGIAILGFEAINNSSWTNSYADAGWCVIPRVWLGHSTTIDTPNQVVNSVTFYIWNQNSQKTVNVDFCVKILYISTSVL